MHRKAELHNHMGTRRLAWGLKWSSASIIWQLVIKVVRGLIIPKLLIPTEYGLFASLGIILAYLKYLDLGISYQLSKELPFHIGRNDRSLYLASLKQGGAWTIFSSLLGGLGIFIYSFLHKRTEFTWFYLPALQILALVFFFSQLRNLLGNVFNAKESFAIGAIGSIIVDSTSFVFAIILLLFLGVIGLVWSLFIAELAGVIYYYYKLGVTPFTFKIKGLFQRLKSSSLQLAIAVGATLLMTIDQLFVLKFYPRQEYGIYALGLFFSTFLVAISGIFLGIIQPRVMFLRGKESPLEIYSTFEHCITAYFLTTVIFLAFLFPGIGFLIHFYLPKYEAGLPVYALQTGIAFSMGLVILFRPFYLTQDREKHLICYQTLTIALAILLDSIIILKKGSMFQISAVSIISFILLGAFMCWEFESSYSKFIYKSKHYLTKYCCLLVGVMGAAIFHYFWTKLDITLFYSKYIWKTINFSLFYFSLIAIFVILKRLAFWESIQFILKKG